MLPRTKIPRAVVLLGIVTTMVMGLFLAPAAHAAGKKPGMPEFPTVTSLDGALSISFAPPSDDGGLPILKYRASVESDDSLHPMDIDVTGPDANGQLTAVVKGLDNLVPYDVYVYAVNAKGMSAAQGPASGTPDIRPNPPTNVTAVPGDGMATVLWTPGAPNGGSDVYNYTVTSSPGGFTADCSESPCDVTGLTNGVAYTFTVVGTNTGTTSPPSAPSAEKVTPKGAPLAPVRVTVLPTTATSVSLTFPPANAAGSPITGYQYRADSDPTWRNISYRAQGSHIVGTVAGFKPGTRHRFVLRSGNDLGVSDASAVSSFLTAPSAVGRPRVRAGTSMVLVVWRAAPEAATTGYRVYARPGGATCTTYDRYDTSCLIGAVAGRRTTFVVVAVDAGGRSALSAPSAATRARAVAVPRRLPAVLGGLSSGKTRKVRSGHRVTVTGSGFLPGSSVTIAGYRGKRVILGRTVVDARGSIRKSVRMPRGSRGRVTFVAFGVTPGGTSKAMSRSLLRTR